MFKLPYVLHSKHIFGDKWLYRRQMALQETNQTKIHVDKIADSDTCIKNKIVSQLGDF